MRQSDVEEGKIYAFFAYWGILCLIPLLGKKDNEFALYHGKQGLMLYIVYMVVLLLATIPFAGWFFIGPLGFLGTVVLAIFGMVKSLSGEYWKMPLFGGLAERIEL